MKVAVICIGNPLMGDDGAGVAVLEILKKSIPSDVQIIDQGTGGLNLLYTLEGLDAAIIVDAVDFGGKPGEVRAFNPEEVDSVKTLGYSLHDVDILSIIELARKMGNCPGILFITAIQPASLSSSTELSPEVKAALPELAEVVLNLLEQIMNQGD